MACSGCSGNATVQTLMAAGASMARRGGELRYVVVDEKGECLVMEMGACVTFSTRAAAEAAAPPGGMAQPVMMENPDA
jgi:hypothetical protein